MNRLAAVVALACMLAGIPSLTLAQQQPAPPAQQQPAAAPAAPAQQGTWILPGQVTGRAGNSFDLKTPVDSGRINVDKDTRFGRLETSGVADLLPGYLVVAVGKRSGEKLNAHGVLRVFKPVGEPSAADWAVVHQVKEAVLNNPAAEAEEQAEKLDDSIGRITTVQNGTIQIIQEDGKALTLETTPKTAYMRYANASWEEVTPGSHVLVISRGEIRNDAATGDMVLVVPAPPQQPRTNTARNAGQTGAKRTGNRPAAKRPAANRNNRGRTGGFPNFRGFRGFRNILKLRR